MFTVFLAPFTNICNGLSLLREPNLSVRIVPFVCACMCAICTLLLLCTLRGILTICNVVDVCDIHVSNIHVTVYIKCFASVAFCVKTLRIL